MTLLYSCCVSTASFSVALLPFVGLGLLIAGLVLVAEEELVLGIVLLCVAVIGCIVAYLVRQRDSMVTIRAGAWPALCRGDKRPRTHDEFLDAVESLGTGKFDVVGGGWTSWMNRSGARRPRLFTDKFHGFDEVTKQWRCGSTIHEMEAYYKKKGRAFPTFPTNTTIALGSWIACENHGNSGDKTGPSHTPFDKVVLLDSTDAKGKTVEFTMKDKPHPVPAARKFMQLKENKGRYVLMYARIDEKKLIEYEDKSTWLQYRMKEIRSADDAQIWLAAGAKLRWLFVGTTRPYGIGVRMVDRKSPEWRDGATHRAFPWCCWERPHIEPHFLSVSARYFQTDPFSFIGGWHEPEENWDGYSNRLHANDWYPNMWWPSVTFGGLALGIRNYEIIFVPPYYPVNGEWLWSLLNDLIELFKNHRGRCEVRCSNRDVDAWMFLDCGIPARWFGKEIFSEPYRILRKHDVEVVSNHTGKWMPPPDVLSGDWGSVRRVPSYALVEESRKARADKSV